EPERQHDSGRLVNRSDRGGASGRPAMNIALLGLVLLLVLLLIVFWYAFRWISMRRRGGVYVALRWHPDRERSGWHLGIGCYRGEAFVWYRVWSLRRGQDRVFHRENLLIVDRRE